MFSQFIADWYAPLSSDAKEFVKSVLAPTVAILLFVLTNIVQN